MVTLMDRMDRTSMHCGLEARVPFADHRIVEYLYNVPWELKCLNGVDHKSLDMDFFFDTIPHLAGFLPLLLLAILLPHHLNILTPTEHYKDIPRSYDQQTMKKFYPKNF